MGGWCRCGDFDAACPDWAAPGDPDGLCAGCRDPEGTCGRLRASKGRPPSRQGPRGGQAWPDLTGVVVQLRGDLDREP